MPQHDNRAYNLYIQLDNQTDDNIPVNTQIPLVFDTENYNFDNGIFFMAKIYYMNNSFNTELYIKIIAINESDSPTGPFTPVNPARLIGTYDGSINKNMVQHSVRIEELYFNGVGLIGKEKRYLQIVREFTTATNSNETAHGLEAVLSPKLFPVNPTRVLAQVQGQT